MATPRTQAINRIRSICQELPEATEKPFGGHTSPAFRVRDKMFVVISEDRASMTVKADEGVQEILVSSDPDRFFVPKYVGSQEWVGIRLDLASQPDWGEMAEIIYESYCAQASRENVGDEPRSMTSRKDPGQERLPLDEGIFGPNPVCAAQRAIVVVEGTTITDLEIPLARESHRP